MLTNSGAVPAPINSAAGKVCRSLYPHQRLSKMRRAFVLSPSASPSPCRFPFKNPRPVMPRLGAQSPRARTHAVTSHRHVYKGTRSFRCPIHAQRLPKPIALPKRCPQGAVRFSPALVIARKVRDLGLNLPTPCGAPIGLSVARPSINSCASPEAAPTP